MSAESPSPRRSLADRYTGVRAATQALAAPLSPEDAAVQSMPDASPTKWHLAHTTWFFETFVLATAEPEVAPFHPAFGYLFNSYYQTVGQMHPRPQRGLLSRPSLDEVRRYRAHVDARMERVLHAGLDDALLAVVEVGLHHEQQHQELVLTDILHALSCNPMKPAYREGAAAAALGTAMPLRFVDHPGGVRSIGHGDTGFAFDNERPRHEVLVHPFRLASRLVTCGEFAEFIDDGGYTQPDLWLSAGWDVVQREGWAAPMYWSRIDGAWQHMTLHGMRAVDPAAPVCHVSLYEADAFARWARARLPTEAEWEVACGERPVEGNFVEGGALQPLPSAADDLGLAQMFGDVWEWTASAYAPYPGFRPLGGSLGEYNGKFMCNQLVLRGGSCATPQSHVRSTYRNFFPPEARWQFSGLRLANDP